MGVDSISTFYENRTMVVMEKIRERIRRLNPFSSDFRVDSKNGWVYLGFGKDLMTGDFGRIYWEKPQNQGITFGAAGSGKSELVARKTYEDILTGFQSFNIDPKGSKSWLEAFLKACYRLGILYDRERGPIILALPYPDISFKFNPLQDLTPHQIAFVIASGIPESKEPFWWQISYEITLVTALGLKARGIKQITFGDIYDYISVEKIEELRDKVTMDVKSWNEYKEEAIRTLDKLSSYDPHYFPTINSSLRTYLTRLITGETGNILNIRTERNLLRERLERGELRFFAFLNAEKMKQTAYDVARLVFAWLLTYVGEKSGRLEVVEPQLRVNIDELTEVGFYEINKMVRLVRERNVSVFMLTQSPSGLRSAFIKSGKNIVEDIINSCDLRIFFRMNSPEDGEYLSQMSPEVERPRAIMHKQSISITYQRSRLIDKFDAQKLKEGYGYAFLDGTVYYFYSPLHKDRLKVAVVWTDEPGKVHADVVVNMKNLARNYLSDIEEENILIVVMSRLKENWKVGKHEEFDDPRIHEFYEETGDFVKVYREDYLKLLDFVQGTKNISSVVKHKKNIFRKISLMDHSLEVALEAYRMVRDNPDLSQEEKERIFLASLAHDLGKAVVEKKNYRKEDHIKATRELLTNLEISAEIVELACKHHDKIQSVLAEYVTKADRKTREKEREEPRVAEEASGASFNAEVFKKRVLMEINRNVDVVLSDDTVFITREHLCELLGSEEIPEEELESQLGGRFVEGRLMNGKKILKENIFFAVPLENLVEEDRINTIKSDKIKGPYRGYRVEVVS